jgi:ABC-type amino acid transport substrate-binding protein
VCAALHLAPERTSAASSLNLRSRPTHEASFDTARRASNNQVIVEKPLQRPGTGCQDHAAAAMACPVESFRPTPTGLEPDRLSPGIAFMSRLSKRLSLALLFAIAVGAASAQTTPLRAGVDPNFPPHAFPKLSGGYQGFNVDLGEEIAKRLGRPLEIEGAQYSALIPALNAGKYDFLLAPTTVSPERAQSVLFTEGYLENNFTLVMKKERADIQKLEDLKGKTVAVNKGSGPEEWARKNQAQYGYEIGVYGTNADAVQAVISGRADANLAGITPSAWAARTSPTIKTAIVIKTGSVWAIPFRLDDKAGRDKVSMALKCMKQDGSLQRLHEKWFGTKAAADSSTVVIASGHGVPGLNGYDAKPVALACK